MYLCMKKYTAMHHLKFFCPCSAPITLRRTSCSASARLASSWLISIYQMGDSTPTPAFCTLFFSLTPLILPAPGSISDVFTQPIYNTLDLCVFHLNSIEPPHLVVLAQWLQLGQHIQLIASLATSLVVCGVAYCRASVRNTGKKDI